MKALFFLTSALLISYNAQAWEGYDQYGEPIEIDNSQNLQEDEEIDVYYFNSENYRHVTIYSVDDSENPSELEVYDEKSNEYISYSIDY